MDPKRETLPAFQNERDEFLKDQMPVNYEQKCPLILVLDVSSSMAGKPIEELNRGIKIFQTRIQNDPVASARLETAILTFGNEIKLIRNFSLFDGNSIETLTANGLTPMAEALKSAIKELNSCKALYKAQGQQYFRPYILLMTDGAPTSSQEQIEEVTKEIQAGVDNNHFNFWAFGVEGADMDLLRKISHPGFAPQKLKGINFGEFFEWLSHSISKITASRSGEQVDITPNKEANPFQFKV